MPADRVGLFIAGTQKARTSALHTYLAEHPAIMSTDHKEPHFFDDESIDWTVPDYALLHARFPGEQNGRLALDATPIYTFWPPALERIRAYNPGARLIVLFRDPIERAWSHWRMETARGDETLGFSEAIRSGRARLDPADPLTRIWRIASYVERGFYTGQVKRLSGLFPSSQTLLLDSGDLARDPQSTLDRIARFAGIAPFGPVRPLREHVGNTDFGSIPPDDAEYLRALFREDVLEFAALSGLDVSHWPTLNPDMPIL